MILQPKNPCLIGGGSCNFQPSLLCQKEGVGHVFFIHQFSKCSGPPHPILFGQSLRTITLASLFQIVLICCRLQLIGNMSSNQHRNLRRSFIPDMCGFVSFAFLITFSVLSPVLGYDETTLVMYRIIDRRKRFTKVMGNKNITQCTSITALLFKPIIIHEARTKHIATLKEDFEISS